MSKKRVLIVTDKFPPNISGGAEVSLHIVAQQLLKQGFDIAVATLNDSLQKTNYLEYEGFRIYEIPFNSSWPPSARNRNRNSGRTSGFMTQSLIATQYLLSPSDSSLRQRLSKLSLYKSLSDLSKLGMFPLVDRDLFSNNIAQPELLKIIEKESPDLLHCDNYRSILLSASFDQLSIPVVACVRDLRFFCAHKTQPMNVNGVVCRKCLYQCADVAVPQETTRLQSLMQDSATLRRAALSKAHHIVVTSRFLHDGVHEMLPGKDITIIANPSDSAEFVDDIQKGIKRSQPPEILIVGMVNENKGQLDVVNWLDFLEKELKDFRIVIAGRGDRLLAKIRQRVNRKNALDRVTMTGFLTRDEVYRSYARATVVASPVVWPEPFGRVPLEAALSRRPIVSYGLGGLNETIIDGVTGRLIAPGDRQAFLQAIVDIIRDPKLAAKMGANARRRVIKSHTAKQAASAMANVWDQFQ